MTCKEERASKLRSLLLGEVSELVTKLTDVQLEVTDCLSGAKRKFASVRFLCAAFSPVMEDMLFGHMAEAKSSCVVPITGCSLRGFEWLLSYFYGLEPCLSAANVVSVLQCAERLLVAEIVNACIAFISEMQAKGSDEMLSIATEIKKLKLESTESLKGAMQSLCSDPLFASTLSSDSLPLADVKKKTTAAFVEPIGEFETDAAVVLKKEDSVKLKTSAASASPKPLLATVTVKGSVIHGRLKAHSAKSAVACDAPESVLDEESEEITFDSSLPTDSGTTRASKTKAVLPSDDARFEIPDEFFVDPHSRLSSDEEDPLVNNRL